MKKIYKAMMLTAYSMLFVVSQFLLVHADIADIPEETPSNLGKIIGLVCGVIVAIVVYFFLSKKKK